MKFNNPFENFSNNAKDKIKKVAKVGLIAGAGMLASNSVEAQSVNLDKKDAENIELSKGRFLDALQKAGVVSPAVTEAYMDTIPKSELDSLTMEYVKATKKLLPHQVKGGIVLSRTSWGVNQKNKNEEALAVVEKEDFNFKEWFADQMEAVRQGKINMGDSVDAPNGVSYKIEIDENAVADAKTSKIKFSESSKVANGLNENTIASIDRESKEASRKFALLKDIYPQQDPEQGLDK